MTRVRLLRIVVTAAVLALLTTGAKGCESTGAPAGGNTSVVYVQDSTGDRWPVKAAVQGWDAGLTISVRYGTCQPHVRCVKVTEAREGFNDTIGSTGIQDTGDADIRMNFSYSWLPPEARLSAACHELGHALGLRRHNEDQDSCMNATAHWGESTRPGKRDLAELNAKAASG